MANSKSAAKRARQTVSCEERNQAIRSRVKTFRRRLSAAIESGDAAEAQKEFTEFSSTLDRAAKTNVIHKNRASKLKSLMQTRVTALAK